MLDSPASPPATPPQVPSDGPSAPVGASAAAGLTLPGLSTAQVSGSVAIPDPIPADALNSLLAVVLAALAKQTEELVHIRVLLQREQEREPASAAITFSPGPASANAGANVGPAAMLHKHGRRFFLVWLNAAHTITFDGPIGTVTYALSQGWNNLSFLADGTQLASGDGTNFTGYALACDAIPPGLL